MWEVVEVNRNLNFRILPANFTGMKLRTRAHKGGPCDSPTLAPGGMPSDGYERKLSLWLTPGRRLQEGLDGVTQHSASFREADG